MRLTADWIGNPASQAVLKALTSAGHQAFFVGGCVRNAIIGAPVSDLDVCTDALPEQTMALAAKAGLRAVPTGIDHGTITVISNGVPYEVTTFRNDVETDGRHAVVRFSEDIHEDARRRDFTMNALYADAEGIVHDPVGGLPDLERRHVRFIGDAEQRIREDYLRILRFFRFTAWYGDPDLGIDEDGLAACGANIDGIELLSAERIGSEMKKLLSAVDPAPSLASMASCGVLNAILPGASAISLAVLVHLEDGEPTGPITRLALIGGEDVATRLRLSNAEKRELETVLVGLSCDIPALGYLHKSTWRQSYLVRQASMGQSIDAAEIESLEHASMQVFPLKAADLMPRYAGAALGTKLRELEQRWIASGFTLSAADLCAD